MTLHISQVKTHVPRVLLRSMQKIKTPKSLSTSTCQLKTEIQLLVGNSRNPRPAMASLATFAAVQPATTIKGLGGSSLNGTKLHVKPSRQSLRPKSIRSGAVVAKYGDKSVYFDLEDLGNTTGQWDLYGSDAPSPYNSLQSKFFETFAAPFTKRGLLLNFLLLGGGSVLAYLSATASGDILPIKKGPQLPPKLGPRGKI